MSKMKNFLIDQMDARRAARRLRIYRAKKYRAPACARLMRLTGVERARAIKIRRIIRGTLDPASVHAAQQWIDQCYHRPHDLELRLCAIDSLLNNHGIEAIPPNFTGARPHAVYSNAGDTYAITIVYSYERDQFILQSWGDYVERNRITE